MRNKLIHKRPMIEVRHSPIHGYGVFALRRIRKGATIVEYLGERISHEEADARYVEKSSQDSHTFLFTVDAQTVIDAGVNGNEARYINHACDPNCQSMRESRRIFVESTRTIQPGEELAYDYQIQRDLDDAADVDEVFACRCGGHDCRGTMLVAPPKRAARGHATSKKADRRKARGRAPR